MSLTWLSSAWARAISSCGGAVLYVCRREPMTGEKVPWSARVGVELSVADDDEGASRN